jgi:fibronectin type 3 domain-containing protein
VILSWKASAPADSKHDAAKGYCIYRGIKPKDPSPELVNPIPIPVTSCTDDLVEDDNKYYYVVRAISANSVASIISNEVPVSIPTGKQSNPSVSGDSAPLCRELASVK